MKLFDGNCYCEVAMKNHETLSGIHEMSHLSLILRNRFIQRWDLFSKQLDDGSYVSIREPLTEDILVAHLEGKLTLGTYVLDKNSQGKYMVLDADSKPEWRKLCALSKVIQQSDCPSYLERSRRGGHLWMFFQEAVSGKDIRLFGSGLYAHFGIEDIELFPKQDHLSTGPGSLIRLPFGVHRKTGRRYGFYKPDRTPLAPTLREQIMALAQPETVTTEFFNHYHAQGEELLEINSKTPLGTCPLTDTRKESEGLQLSDRIKAAIPVRQFVLCYVELSKRGLGKCPFHDDQVESFSVNEDGNYWHCFGCDAGGSIIDFYMRWHDCDFTSAVKELATELH